MREPSLEFLILAFALAIPFWLLGAAVDLNLLPGLPLAALATFCPAAAAVIVARRRHGSASALLRRAFDFGRIKSPIWYLLILLLMPGIMTAAFFVQRFSGTNLPIPSVKPFPALILCLALFIAALGEELGWCVFATEPLQRRFGLLGAGLLLGLIWVAYHLIGLAEAHRPVAWIAWWSLGTIALRVIMTWLYDRTGRSVLAVALFHMTINATWQLFPVEGSFYDPRVTSLIIAAVAMAIIALNHAVTRTAEFADDGRWRIRR